MSTFDTPMDWLDDQTWDDPWHPVATDRKPTDRVPVGPTRRHIAQLRDKGWTRSGIAYAAGVSPHLIQGLECVVVACERKTAEAVLAITGPPPKVGPGGHPVTRTAVHLFETEQAAVHWVDRAACRGMDTSMFFPERGASHKEARAVCAQCPVQRECGEKALANNEHHGIWAGQSERQRRSLRRDAA